MVLAYAHDDTTKERPMALKIMAKSHMVETDQVIQVMREKTVLMALPRHPFIVDLHATFQVQSRIFLSLSSC